MTIEKMLKNFKTLDLQKLGTEVLVDQKQSVIKLNSDQMLDNLSSKGRSLGEYASKGYRAWKIKRGRSGRVDMNNTGAFHNAMKLNIITKNKYEVTSTDRKTAMLKKKYGEDVFGMNPQSTEEYRKEFMPELREKVKRYIYAE